MVAGVGFEPHDLRVMRASIGFGFKIHRLAKTYADAPEPTQKPTNVGGRVRLDLILRSPAFRFLVLLPKVSSWNFAVLCVLPFSPNVVPALESHPSVALLMSSQSHIPFGRSFNFEDVLSLWLNLDKQKEPITQSIRNRRERGSRFKMMFYVIGSEESKSGSASYSSRQQNQRRGGAVRHFRCTDTVSDEPTNYVSIWSNISIQLLCMYGSFITALLYKM